MNCIPRTVFKQTIQATVFKQSCFLFFFFSKFWASSNSWHLAINQLQLTQVSFNLSRIPWVTISSNLKWPRSHLLKSISQTRLFTYNALKPLLERSKPIYVCIVLPPHTYCDANKFESSPNKAVRSMPDSVFLQYTAHGLYLHVRSWSPAAWSPIVNHTQTLHGFPSFFISLTVTRFPQTSGYNGNSPSPDMATFSPLQTKWMAVSCPFAPFAGSEWCCRLPLRFISPRLWRIQAARDFAATEWWRHL